MRDRSGFDFWLRGATAIMLIVYMIIGGIPSELLPIYSSIIVLLCTKESAD